MAYGPYLRLCSYGSCINNAQDGDHMCERCRVYSNGKVLMLNITKSDPAPKVVTIPSALQNLCGRREGTLGGLNEAKRIIDQIILNTTVPRPTYSINGLKLEDLSELRQGLVTLQSGFAFYAKAESAVARLIQLIGEIKTP